MSFFDPNDPDTWGGSGSSNTAPTVTSGSSANFAENGTGTVYTAQASDGQGHTITWSLSGIDAGRFNIVSSTGVVTFKVAPDFEVPTDNGLNNVYNTPSPPPITVPRISRARRMLWPSP
jgi:hypothetical protein